MLRRKALRKIMITTMSVFIIMAIYLIPTTTKEKTLSTNLELEYITGLGNNSVYLLNDHQYLVKSRILLDSNDMIENIKTLLANLIVTDHGKTPLGLRGVIPKDTKVLTVSQKENNITIDFSNQFLTIEKDQEKKMLEAIVYSITGLKGVTGVQILVEGEPLTAYPNSKELLPEVLTKENIGINKEYDIERTKDINKVVIYYLENLNDTNYYVPVTKYLNDARDKMDIIIEELTTSYIYEPNLSSLVNENTKLMDYEQQDDLMILNFNQALFDTDGQIKEEVLYTISYSVFENYDVNTTTFRVNNKEVKTIKKVDLP